MNILIVKTSSLGDIIHTYPVVAYLKSRMSDAQIDWIVEEPYAELVRCHPDIRNTFPVKTRSWRKSPFSTETWREIKDFRKNLREQTYDFVIDLQGNIKSGLLTWQAKSKTKIGFGFKTVPESPNLFFTNTHFNPPSGNNIRQDYLFLIQSYFKDSNHFQDPGIILRTTKQQNSFIEKLLQNPILQKKPVIMICPGSAWPNKQMTFEALLELMQLLQPNSSFLLIWGSQEELATVKKLQDKFPNNSVIVDRMPLPALQSLMGQVNQVIAMDSLPLHLAGTTSTPTFGVFGASSAHKYQPMGKDSIQGACPYGRSFEKRCPILRTCPTGLCIRGLKGHDVYAKINKTN